MSEFKQFYKTLAPQASDATYLEKWAEYAWNHQQLRINELTSAAKFFESFAPKTKAIKGLDPTFYFTGTYKGDDELDRRLNMARELLEKCSSK